MEKRTAIPPGLPRQNPTLSYWQQPPDKIADCRTTEKLPEHADIVIIGSGISGASVAYNLLDAQPKADVLMLEARQAASGASGRNGGHTKTAAYRSFFDNATLVGEEDAIKISKLEYDCMAAVHDFIRDQRLDCDSRICDTVDVFYNQDKFNEAKKSVALMEKLIGSSHLVSKHQFYSADETAKQFLAEGSLGSVKYDSGSLSAYKLTISVLKLALEKGLNLQCNTAVSSLSKSGQYWTVTTDRGTVHANRVVLATNGYSPHLLPELQGVIVPFRGIITAQRPGKGMPQQGMDTTFSFIYEDGYEYMITRPKGTENEGDVVIGGGLMKGSGPEGIEEFGETDDTSIDPAIKQYLTNCTEQFFGNNWGADNLEGRVRHTWSGVMGYSADGYPLVGPMPGKEGLFIDASFQGHGMVLCFLCAKAVTDMILGKDGPELDKWFPKCYRVSKERLQQRFTGRAH